ncbi:MAG TPA: glycoside hydrolase family 3 N-terminal domain-containing protein, partial [Polyangia bacterium]
ATAVSVRPSLFPTRRRFLGMSAAAGASLTPLACAAPRPGATPLPSAAEVPPARKAGVPSPDVEALFAQMTLDEKIGQMTQADMKALKDGKEIHSYLLGSVLSGADSLPKPNEPATWVAMYDRYQGQALSTRLGIPMLYGVDAVHGHGACKGATIFPHNIGMGCTRDPALVEAAGRVTAREVAGTGIDWNFAPCLAVARDERWGRTYESYGESPELAESLGAAAIRGMEQATDGSAILATAKHFLADGGTQGGKDQGDARISEEELRRIHLPGYVAAVKAGVGSVMVSYSSWNGEFMHGNKHLITDVLKGELGFGGFVVTDWQAIDRMAPGDYSKAIELALNAGIDMVMVPNAYPDFIARAKALVAAGRVPQARIDDAVRRILKQKVRFKLWEKPFTDPALTAQIGAPAHRAVARDAVRKSLVVLKNDKQTLPLRKEARIHLCGLRADNMGIQCGGWSVGWRGRRGAITPGTTIRQAIEKVVGAARLDYSENAAGAEKADAVVVVVGEDPYAEGSGDRAKLELGAQDLALIDAAKRSGKPVVVVLLSGRPLILGDVLDAAPAVVAAWLPGTEGDGVADVLFGAYKPTGKLSCSWPANMSQIPINVGDPRYAPLFPYGHGLSW